MPALPRARRLAALAVSGCALTCGVTATTATAHPRAHHPSHHRRAKPKPRVAADSRVGRHRHHPTKAATHATATPRTAASTTTTTTTKTTTTTTTSTAVPPTTTASTTPTVALPSASTTTPAATTPTATTSAGQILFQNSYPASGNALNLAGTGWKAAQYPSDGVVPEPDRLQFVAPPGSPEDPNLPATNVARFQLNPYSNGAGPTGDVTDTGGYLANRVEVYGRYGGSLPAAQWPDPVGSTRWYSFSVYIPTGFPTATSSAQWFDFTQWKGLNSGSPPVAMEIRGTNFVLGGQNSDRVLGPLDPGSWTHFVVGLDFSDSAATGWATVYMNGSMVVDQAPTQTMNEATVDGVTGVDPDYLKMGIYRSETWQVTQVIYLTPMTIGTTLASVS